MTLQKNLISWILFFSFVEMQGQQNAFKGVFVEKVNDISLRLDLYNETIPIPNFSFLGNTNGYMNGNIYGIWIVTKARIEGKKAEIHLSNEFGSESQVVTLYQISDSTYRYEAQSPLVIKKVVNKKLQKIPANFILRKVEN